MTSIGFAGQIAIFTIVGIICHIPCSEPVAKKDCSIPSDILNVVYIRVTHERFPLANLAPPGANARKPSSSLYQAFTSNIAAARSEGQREYDLHKVIGRRARPKAIESAFLSAVRSPA
jgi:hypothetical protein